MTNQYLTTQEVADLLGVSHQSVSKQLRRGKRGPFPNARKFGQRAWLIPASDVRQYRKMRAQKEIER